MKFNRIHGVLVVLLLLPAQLFAPVPLLHGYTCNGLRRECRKYGDSRTDVLTPEYWYRECMSHNNYWTRIAAHQCDY